MKKKAYVVDTTFNTTLVCLIRFLLYNRTETKTAFNTTLVCLIPVTAYA